MAIDDVLFDPGGAQHFILEVPTDIVHSPLDILTDKNCNTCMPCLETSLVVTPAPKIVMLSDGNLAKRITSKFYLKLK